MESLILGVLRYLRVLPITRRRGGSMVAHAAVVLVDYDNVKRVRDERTSTDVANNLAEIIQASVDEARRAFGDCDEIIFRIYGGWLDERGIQSARAQWLVTGLSWHRGRVRGAIVKPSLVTALACRSADNLLGTVRQSRRGLQQKMVDAMMVVDTIHYVRDEALPIVLFTDDDDLLPAAIAATAMAPKARVHWVRRRNVGSALNDALLSRAKVTLGSIP